MFVHTVLIRTRRDTNANELGELSRRIADLAMTVCGAGEFIVGANATEEPFAEGFDFGFVLRFPNRGALDAYLVNPAHLAISLLIRDVAESILVFDLDGNS